MEGVEFVERDADGGWVPLREDTTTDGGPAAGVAGPRASLRLPWPAWAPALSWLAAAILSVVASFQLVFRASFPADFDTSVTLSLDGWGRSQVRGAPILMFGARTGIALSVVAVLFLVAAVLAVLSAMSVISTTWPSAGTGLAGCAALSGVLGATALQVAAQDNSLHAYVNQQLNGVNRPSLTFQVGPLFWWGLAAVLAGVLGLVAALSRRHTPAAGPADPGVGGGSSQAAAYHAPHLDHRDENLDDPSPWHPAPESTVAAGAVDPAAPSRDW